MSARYTLLTVLLVICVISCRKNEPAATIVTPKKTPLESLKAFAARRGLVWHGTRRRGHNANRGGGPVGGYIIFDYGYDIVDSIYITVGDSFVSVVNSDPAKPHFSALELTSSNDVWLTYRIGAHTGYRDDEEQRFKYYVQGDSAIYTYDYLGFYDSSTSLQFRYP
jgi:hypothetical protein